MFDATLKKAVQQDCARKTERERKEEMKEERKNVLKKVQEKRQRWGKKKGLKVHELQGGKRERQIPLCQRKQCLLNR